MPRRTTIRRRSATPTRHFSIFLLKAEITDPGDAVLGTPRSATVPCGSDVAATLYYQQTRSRTPGWASFFKGTPVEPQLDSLFSAGNAAVLLVPAGGRWFALAWGSGRHLLVPGTWEENFGLKATLNSITADQVRSVDHVSFDAYTMLKRAQSSRAGTCLDFGVDVDQNLVKALTGTPTDPTLAARMSGVDALSVSVAVTLPDLPPLLERYLAQFSSDNYKAQFGWVDHLRQVNDRTRLDSLNDELMRKLRADERDRLWMAVPDILDWDDVEEFSYRQGARAPRYHDTLLPDFLASIDSTRIDLATMKRHQVYGYRDGSADPFNKWSAYRCMYAELEQGEDTYLLYDGKWYRVTRDFVQLTNAAVARLAVPSTLPAFDFAVHRDEEAYNLAVGLAHPQYCVMDRKLITHGASPGGIEFCDLFSLDRRMVHVKRYGGSATLSHLFNQGDVPARYLQRDSGFRAKVIAGLPATHQGLVAQDGLQPSDFTVVFAITSESTKDIASSLPFFSRMTLVRVADTLRASGYNVELMKIDVVEARPIITATATPAPPQAPPPPP